MDSLILAFAQNPLYHIGVLLAVCAAAGGLIFLWGLLSGAGNLFHMHGHEGHLEHARVRVVWGLYLCMFVLGLWEILRVIVGEAPLSYLWFSLLLLAPAWLPWLYGLVTGKSGH